ncbi:MAG: phytanoyl-CoA dioxygenase [Rhodospirillales bacterium]|nr:phytanoyl-CoA dioxygenase [Rhodospirillales bacterium]
MALAASKQLEITDVDPEQIMLTATQLSVFKSNGFVTMSQVTSDTDLATIRETLEDLFTRRCGLAEGAFFDFAGSSDEDGVFALPQLLDPRSFAPNLMNSEFFHNAMAIARQLLGPEAAFAADHALVKPAQFGGPTPWHQDDAFQDSGVVRDEISIWMPLQAVDRINGCMSFIPGTGRSEVLPHRSLNGDSSIHGLECISGFDRATAVTCPIPAGGCTIHSSRTVHGAGANRSAKPRFAYVLIFNTPPKGPLVSQPRPWLEGKMTPRMKRRRAWMRRGGLIVHSWRRLKQIKQIGLHEMSIRIIWKLRKFLGESHAVAKLLHIS